MSARPWGSSPRAELLTLATGQHDMALQSLQTNPTPLPPDTREEPTCIVERIWGTSSSENEPKSK